MDTAVEMDAALENQAWDAVIADYLLPLATDVPRIEIGHMVSPSPLNPLGVKGAGEGGTLPAIAAIIAAVEDALSPFGVTINEAPITPMRIVELIRQQAPATYA